MKDKGGRMKLVTNLAQLIFILQPLSVHYTFMTVCFSML